VQTCTFPTKMEGWWTWICQLCAHIWKLPATKDAPHVGIGTTDNTKRLLAHPFK
jgi:hypothetical protein